MAYAMPSKLWINPINSQNEMVLQTMVMGFNMEIRSVKPHYRLMGFEFHGGGGQVCALNAPWLSHDFIYLRFVRVLK